MHKIFAKPTFLGKKVVFLPQCHSTNDELSALSKEKNIPEGTVIYTDHQISGKGQRGNQWEDEPGKNILLSILLNPKKLPVHDQYYLNLIAGLAVLEVLKEKWIHRTLNSQIIRLKWPNDVYIDKKKVAGILIENNIKGAEIDTSIVGIGLNLNQERSLPKNATSIINELARSMDRVEFIDDVLLAIEKWYMILSARRYEEILAKYHDSLYWKNEIHTFKDTKSKFTGIIRGINENGRLVIETTKGERIFDVKEVQFID